MTILLIAVGIAGILIAGFIIIARKGRALRRNQPLPPPATTAHLEWNGRIVKVECPFYIGNGDQSNLVLSGARASYEACIFQHTGRFAFQTLKGGGEIRVNGEEMLAGYLWDGDTLLIANEPLRFRCS